MPWSQLIEHDPLQVTRQSAPLVQETLPLLPTSTSQLERSHVMLPLAPVVSSQLAPSLQSALHDPAQTPLQLSEPRQWNEQLPPCVSQPVSPLPVQEQL